MQATYADVNTQFTLAEDTLRMFRDDGPEEADGKVARLRVFNGVLTDAEVAAIAGGSSGDADGDNVLDGSDACPNVAAATADGCPVPEPTPTPTPTPEPTPTPTPSPAGTVSDSAKRSVSAHKGIYRFASGVTAACASAGACTATAVLKKGKDTLGSATIALAAGKSAGVVVRLSKAAAKRLKKAKTLRATLTVVLQRTGATPVTLTRSVTLKARAGKKKPKPKPKPKG